MWISLDDTRFKIEIEKEKFSFRSKSTFKLKHTLDSHIKLESMGDSDCRTSVHLMIICFVFRFRLN